MTADLNEKNFNEICRTCLKTAKRKNSLFDVEVGSQKKIAEMLEIITKLQISANDKLPQKVCYKCTALIKSAYNFKNQSEQNEKILLKYLNTKKELDETTENISELINNVFDIKLDSVYATIADDDSVSVTNFEKLGSLEMLNDLPIEQCDVDVNTISETQGIEINNIDKHDFIDLKTEKQATEIDIVKLTDPVSKETVNVSKEKLISNPTTHVKKLKNDQILISILDPRFDYDENGDYLCTLCHTSFKYRRYLLRHKKKHEKQAKKAEKIRLKEIQKQKRKRKNSETSDESQQANVLKTEENDQVCGEISVADNLEGKVNVFVGKESIIKDVENNDNNQNNTLLDDPEAEELENIFKPIIRRKYAKHKTETKTSTCEICQKVLSTSVQLKKHKLVHDPNRPKYKCQLCGKEFTDPSTLKKHKRKFHEVNCQSLLNKGSKQRTRKLCTSCGKYVSDYRKHILTHTNERAHKCDQCDKSFRIKTQLKDHKRTHSGEKPFACDICGKCFHRKDLVRNHKRIHGEEKKHKCTYCEKSFIYPKELTYHVRRHTDEKPFECGNCEKAFVLKHELTKHCKVRNHNPKPGITITATV